MTGIEPASRAWKASALPLSYTRELLRAYHRWPAGQGRWTVDRGAWLRERRRVATERYDTLHAATYDQQEWAAISPTHHRFVDQLIQRCPPGGRILDAACGTGRHTAHLFETGHEVTGVDGLTPTTLEQFSHWMLLAPPARDDDRDLGKSQQLAGG